MSEQSKVERTVEIIHQEYSQLAAKLGHLLYTAHVHSADAELVKERMKDLNLEAAELQAKQAAPKAE